MNTYKTISTGTAALTVSISTPALNSYWELAQVNLHLSSAGATGNFTITRNSGDDYKYSTLLKTLTMDTLTDYAWSPDEKILLNPEDKLAFYWANTAGITYGITVLTKKSKG